MNPHHLAIRRQAIRAIVTLWSEDAPAVASSEAFLLRPMAAPGIDLGTNVLSGSGNRRLDSISSRMTVNAQV